MRTFENFHVTASNKHAYETAKSIAESIVSNGSASLCLTGKPYVGKTHLLNAIHREIILNAPGLLVLHTSAEAYCNTLVHATEDRRLREFTDWVASMDVLIIENIEDVLRKKATQQELLSVFGRMGRDNRSVIIDICLQESDKLLVKHFIKAMKNEMQSLKVAEITGECMYMPTSPATSMAEAELRYHSLIAAGGIYENQEI